MEIQKIFSNIEDPEENLYSVLLDDTEIELVSEFQKEYARKDYEGLDQEGKKALKKRRDSYAKALKENYRKTQKDINKLGEEFKSKDRTNGIYGLASNKEINTKLTTSGGGVKTNTQVHTRKGFLDSTDSFVKQHKKGVTDYMLKGSSEAKDIMRNEELAKSRDRAKLGQIVGDRRKRSKDSSRKIEEAALKENGISKELKQRTEAYKIKKAEKAAERAAQSQASIAKHAEKAKELKNLKNKRIVGKTALGAAAGIGLAYGGKKLYDHYKKNDKED